MTAFAETFVKDLRKFCRMILSNEVTETFRCSETTINYSINIGNIPPSPVQHAEFTVAHKMPKSRRASRQLRLISDRDSQAVQSVGESFRQMKCFSRERNSKVVTICDSVQMMTSNNGSVAARQRGGGEESLYDITANISKWKYSHIDRMTLLKDFTR